MTTTRREDSVIELANGRRVGVLDRGPADGAPVLYLHGMPGSRLEQLIVPDHVLDRLGVRVVSVDRPGYGATDPLAGSRPERAQDALGVADLCGLQRFAVLAVSAGGTNAVTLAALASDRVTRLVLCSAQMPYDDESAIGDLQPAQLAMLPVFRRGRTPELVQGFEAERAALLTDPIAAMATALHTRSEAEREWFAQPWVRDVFNDDMREAIRAQVDGYLDDALLWPVAFEVDPAAVRCPVVAVHGTADDWEPLANLRRILDVMSRTELVLLDCRNHFGPLQHPAALLALTIS